MATIAIPGGSSPASPILDAELDHIELLQSGIHIQPAGTADAEAELRTIGDRVIPGDVDDWIVEDEGVAIHLGGGVFEYVSTGSTMAVAVKDAVESLPMLITTGPGTSHPNQPVGHTPLLTHDGQTVEANGQFEEIWRQQSSSVFVRGNFEIDPGDQKKMRTTRSMHYKIATVEYEKVATSGITFSAAHEIAPDCYGCIIIQINAAGTFSTKVAADPQTYNRFYGEVGAATSAYAQEVGAGPDGGNIICGLVHILAGPSGWVANTDNLSLGPDHPEPQEDYADAGMQNGGLALDLQPFAIPRDYTGGVRIVEDADVPNGPDNVLELSLAQIITAGSGGARMDATMLHVNPSSENVFGADEVYLSCLLKLSPGYCANSERTVGATNKGGAGALKMFIILTRNRQFLDGGYHFGMGNSNALGALTSPVTISLSIPEAAGVSEHDGLEPVSAEPWRQGFTAYVPTGGRPGDPGDLQARGTWHFVEYLFRFNTPGLADGFMQGWIDGDEILPTNGASAFLIDGLLVQGIRMAQSPPGARDYENQRFVHLEIDTTWGGGGPNLWCGDGHYIRIKHLYMSGKHARAGCRPSHWVMSASTIVPAGSFVVDTEYVITAVGDTDFTLIGASSNTIGVVFTATGAGSGTGQAIATATAGTATTIAQGGIVRVTGTLVDENDDPVLIYGMYPKVVTFDGVDGAAWAQNGTGSNGVWVPVGATPGTYSLHITADADASIGQDITVGYRTWPRISDGIGTLLEGDEQPTPTPISLEIVAP